MCLGRRIKNTNWCVIYGTEEYCRTEATGVILGVEDSTIVETKQKNSLS